MHTCIFYSANFVWDHYIGFGGTAAVLISAGYIYRSYSSPLIIPSTRPRFSLTETEEEQEARRFIRWFSKIHASYKKEFEPTMFSYYQAPKNLLLFIKKDRWLHKYPNLEFVTYHHILVTAANKISQISENPEDLHEIFGNEYYLISDKILILGQIGAFDLLLEPTKLGFQQLLIDIAKIQKMPNLSPKEKVTVLHEVLRD